MSYVNDLHQDCQMDYTFQCVMCDCDRDRDIDIKVTVDGTQQSCGSSERAKFIRFRSLQA
jgi:hypothetical protein